MYAIENQTVQHSSRRLRGPAFVGLIAATLIALTACGGQNAVATESVDTAFARSAVAQLAGASTACPTGPRVADIVRQGVAVPATCTSGSWLFTIPADATPMRVRRSEAVWTRPGRSATRFAAGSVVTYDASFVGNLGAAGQADGDWHVLWQLQGKTRRRGWVPPSMSLTVRHGELRIEGGHGHPRHNWATRSYWWHRSLGTYRDGRVYHVRIAVRLSPNPARSRVTATLNGVRKLTRWSPRSPEGYSAGTIYPDQAWVESRSGLYRGTENGSPPTFRQFVTLRVARLG